MANKRKQENAPRLWTPVFVAIVVSTLCCYIVGQGTNAGTSVYLSRMGATATLAGVGGAVFSAAAAVTRFASGALADTRGRVVVITAGAAILLAGTLGAGFFPDFNLFVLWRFLQGVGFSAVTTSAATAAADVLPAERLGEGIGYFGLGQAIAMSFGPAIAIFLVSTDPAENLFWGLSVSAAASLLVSFLCHYENNIERLPETSTYRCNVERRRRERLERERQACVSEAVHAGETLAVEGSAAGNADVAFAAGMPDVGGSSAAGSELGFAADGASRADADSGSPIDKPVRSGGGWRAMLGALFELKALAGAWPMMVICPTFGFGIYFAGLFGATLGVANAGVFYTVSALAMIAVRLSSKSFMDRLPAIKLFAFAAACGLAFAVLFFVLSVAHFGHEMSNVLFYLAGLPYGLCLGMALPVNQAVAVKNSPSERWGAANGLFLLSTDLGIGVATILWGVSSDLFGFSVTFVIIAALVLASVGVAWITYPPSEKRL